MCKWLRREGKEDRVGLHNTSVVGSEAPICLNQTQPWIVLVFRSSTIFSTSMKVRHLMWMWYTFCIDVNMLRRQWHMHVSRYLETLTANMLSGRLGYSAVKYQHRNTSLALDSSCLSLFLWTTLRRGLPSLTRSCVASSALSLPHLVPHCCWSYRSAYRRTNDPGNRCWPVGGSAAAK